MKRRTAYILVTCKSCGKQLEVPPSYRLKKYCSKDCWYSSPELKDVVSRAQSGKDMSFETRQKLREYGKTQDHSKQIEAMRQANLGQFYPWQAQIDEGYSTDWTCTLTRSIRERDHYTCRLCGKQQTGKSFDVHHIDYDKTNCDPRNLITLCHSCHGKTNKNRQSWKVFFRKLIDIQVKTRDRKEK